MHAHLAGLPFALQLCHYVFVTHTYRVSFFCRYAQVTKRVTSGHQQVYDVIVLPQQQPAVVKFARHPYSEEVHVECANRQLAPELLGVYPMPGGFNQVQSLARNSSACIQFADPELEAAVKAALKELHAANDYRHGDIRRPNLMFR